MASKEYIGWEKIDELGKEYHSLVKAGFGLSPETRSKRQIELANMIISNSRDYLYKLAGGLVFRGGYKMFKATLSLGYEQKRISSTSHNEKEMNIGELVDAAAIGIIESLKNYDPGKGHLKNFISYNAIASMFNERKKLGLVKVRLSSMARKRAIELMEHDSYYGLVNALSQELGSTDSAYLAYLGLTGDYYSLNSANNSNGKRGARRDRLEDRIKDPNAMMQEDEIANREILFYTGQALHCLSQMEQKVIAMHLGLDGNEGRTLEQIGYKLGFSRERIRQIEAGAFSKIHMELVKQKAL